MTILCGFLVGCGDDRRVSSGQPQQQQQQQADGQEVGGIQANVVFETLYLVDGVQVVVENGNGPSQGRMLKAVHIFRKAANALLELEPEREEEIWQSIVEIRWSDGLVPPIGGAYDPDAATLAFEFHSCIVDAPFFRLLMTHYYHAETGGIELPESLVAWAEDFSADSIALCSPEGSYPIDGVQVVVENDNGPTLGTMLRATYIFRDAARELYKMDEESERAVWQTIAEIRWDDELVAPVGGTYDFETAELLLEYHGCIVDPPLFQLLALHYHHAETGETELNDFLTAWSEGLAAGNTELCAPGVW
jgi:hypothetical protein